MDFKRRDLLQLTAAGLALSVVGARPANSQQADTIRIALAAAGPRQSDPNTAVQGPDFWAIENLYEQLVRPPDGTFGVRPEDFKPILAESWTVSDNSRTWRFQLRKGVQFHKGYGEMTSEDVIYSFERAKTGTRAALFANIDTVEADGPYGFTMKLKLPDPLALGSIVFTPNTAVVSKKAATEMGEGFRTSAVGTGPYELVKFDANSGVYLKSFQKYWGEKAKTPNLEILYIADTTARTLALLSKQADMIEGVRAPGWIQSMQGQDPTLKFDMTVPGSFNTLHFNLSRKPFDNLVVRQAIAYGIDQVAIAQALAPMGAPMFGLQPPSFPAGFASADFPDDVRYAYNPDRSKDLLAKAGYASGLTFDCFCSQREDYASTMLIVQEQLRSVNINMNLQLIDHSTFHANSDKDQNTLIMIASSYPPIPAQLYSDYLSAKSNVKGDGTGGQNYSHYGVAIPGVDKQLDTVAHASSYDEYVAACKQVELQVRQDLPVMGLGTLSYTIARNARVNVGYEVKSGYARWRLDKATIT